MLIVHSFTIAQSLSSENNIWNVRLTALFNEVHYSTEIFMYNGDTTINSLTYNKIWNSIDSLETQQFMGLIRENQDTVFYTSPNGESGILYNFNLDVGDTATVINYFCSSNFIEVNAIDSVQYFGQWRKRWHINSFGEFWIEGIGSNFGPLYSNYHECIVCPGWDLLCFHANNNLEYELESNMGCYINTLGTGELIESNFFQIEKNPVLNGNPIEFTSDLPINKLEIYNSSGQLVLAREELKAGKHNIQSSPLNRGIYYLKVQSTSSAIRTEKIIIE